MSNLTLNKSLNLAAGEQSEIIYNIENIPLAAGRYFLTLYCEAGGQVQDWIKDAFSFDIENVDFYNSGKLPPAGHGSLLLKYSLDQK
jgi:lipopolysaccharide transport system ATP-binding protein